VNTVPMRRTMTLVLLFIAVSVAFIVLDNRQSIAPLRTALDDLVGPAAEFFEGVADGPENTTELERQLAETEADRDKLRKENAELKAYRDEVRVLREQQKVQEDFPDYTLVSARVISSDPTGRQLFVVINKGSDDGLQEGMAVVNPNSYVGQLTDVTSNQAQVTLIIDNSMQVGAKLVDTRTDGVVYGQWLSGKRLEMRHIDPDAKLKVGEMVVTSDQTTSQTRGVPPNIPIGAVGAEPEVDPRTAQLVIQVYPYTNFDDLELVWVMVPNV
jgi:rod shape-determining protein MreC